MPQPIKAKKHLGQHFLCDQGIAQRIVEALLEKDRFTPVIEVGPGTGILTQHLIELPGFMALDVDKESVEHLHQKYLPQKSRILLSDFLETDLKSLAGEKFNVIGNFPYNISSQIMFKVLEEKNSIHWVVGMFQKEVAQRLAEKPGTKTYGILSVLLQAYFEIEYLFTVHENVFSPPPKVKSAVIRLKRNEVKSLNCNEDLFKKVIKTCFNQRRKTIRNSIKPLLNGKTISHPLLDKRPEQLSVTEFVELTRKVENL